VGYSYYRFSFPLQYTEYTNEKATPIENQKAIKINIVIGASFGVIRPKTNNESSRINSRFSKNGISLVGAIATLISG